MLTTDQHAALAALAHRPHVTVIDWYPDVIQVSGDEWDMDNLVGEVPTGTATPREVKAAFPAYRVTEPNPDNAFIPNEVA
jgi:hypothetical protein